MEHHDSESIKKEFARELAKSDANLNLAYAALKISQYITAATFDPKRYLDDLDNIAELARPRVERAVTDVDKIETVNEHLFDRLGFFGSASDYYNPNNSFLDKVLELRQGIPITLSLIYLEIGQRLDLLVWGIGMPRHFIVGYGPVPDPVYIDVFDQGKIITEQDCLLISGVRPVNRQAFRANFLKPVAKKAILYRILLNLKHIYISRSDWQLAYKTTDLMLQIPPRQLKDLKDRGLLAYRTQRLQNAIFDLKRYLFLASKEEDVDWVERQVKVIEEQLLRLN